MNIPDKINAHSKSNMDIKMAENKQVAKVKSDVNTEDIAKVEEKPEVSAEVSAAVAADVNGVSTQTRNISFKINEQTEEMYVEITDDDDEVVRTIPADENDPKFMALVQQSTPGMIINDKG